MYLSKVRLVNWRSYADVTFEFDKPTQRRPLVLIGALNGHGKTSFLVALYLGLFGRFGLRYCEGFGNFDAQNNLSYRKFLPLFRRNTASNDEPTSIEIVFSPTLNDENEEEIRVVRRWFYSSVTWEGRTTSQLRMGDFEQVEVYRGGTLYKLADLDAAFDRIEKSLFPAHIMPAFIFDGEQAQMLISTSKGEGIKKSVEVMFGTKILEEVHDQVQQYLKYCHQKQGGKNRSSQTEDDLRAKIDERDQLNRRIARLQKEESEISDEKDRIELERRDAQERLALLGGTKALDVKRIQDEVLAAEREKDKAERSLSESTRNLGLALALSRLATPLANRLLAEEVRETWERLRVGTLDRADQVLAAAMPEPAEEDELLGFLAPDLRERVRSRFKLALEQIYNPPPIGCAPEFLFAHVKGEQRQAVTEILGRVRKKSALEIRRRAKKLKEAQEAYEEATARTERLSNLPNEINEIVQQIEVFNQQIAEALRQLSSRENEIKKFKADLHELNKIIGMLQEEAAKMEPAQKRIAVAERAHRVMDDLLDRLRPIALSRLEEVVTRHFLKIADPRFKGRIAFPAGDNPPVFQWRNGTVQQIDIMSGFERRSFGIAFSLALAEITKKRVPLVIDTPLGNADSEYRPRLLKALTQVDLDQVIILTHDQEVHGNLLDLVEPQVLQKFLVRYDQATGCSEVFEDAYFGGIA